MLILRRLNGDTYDNFPSLEDIDPNYVKLIDDCCQDMVQWGHKSSVGQRLSDLQYSPAPWVHPICSGICRYRRSWPNSPQSANFRKPFSPFLPSRNDSIGPSTICSFSVNTHSCLQRPSQTSTKAIQKHSSIMRESSFIPVRHSPKPRETWNFSRQ